MEGWAGPTQNASFQDLVTWGGCISAIEAGQAIAPMHYPRL